MTETNDERTSEWERQGGVRDASKRFDSSETDLSFLGNRRGEREEHKRVMVETGIKDRDEGVERGSVESKRVRGRSGESEGGSSIRFRGR